MLRVEPKGLQHKTFCIYAASSTFAGDFQHIFMSRHASRNINHIGAKFHLMMVSKCGTVRYTPSVNITKNANNLLVVLFYPLNLIISSNRKCPTSPYRTFLSIHVGTSQSVKTTYHLHHMPFPLNSLTRSALNLIRNIVFLLFLIKRAHRACTAALPLTTLPNNSPTATNIKQSR